MSSRCAITRHTAVVRVAMLNSSERASTLQRSIKQQGGSLWSPFPQTLNSDPCEVPPCSPARLNYLLRTKICKVLGTRP